MLLKLGVIEPSKCSWASPVVLVTNKDEYFRLCMDFRLINSHHLKDSYPLPRIDGSIDALGGSQWFSTLFNLCYTILPLLAKFKVIPFGLANTPAIFEWIMEHVLSGLHWETCLIHSDDVIIFSKAFKEHIAYLHQLLTQLKEANLKLPPSKCKLFHPQDEYLGHVVSKDGVASDLLEIHFYHYSLVSIVRFISGTHSSSSTRRIMMLDMLLW